MNSLYQQLNQNQNNSSDSNLQTVLTLVKNSGMSAKDLFYKMAKERNVNPEDILKQLR